VRQHTKVFAEFGSNHPVIRNSLMVSDSRAPLQYLRGLACNYDIN